MKFNLRAASLTDAAEIARLALELGYHTSEEEMSKRLEALSGDGRFVVMVAEAHEEFLLGWISGEHRSSLESGEFWEITGLVVDSRGRRNGVGKALTQFVERWAVARGAISVRVRSNVLREESHSFYQRNGYSRQKTQHAYSKRLTNGTGE